MIVDIVDKYLTDDNNPIKNLRLKKCDYAFSFINGKHCYIFKAFVVQTAPVKYKRKLF
jgi:hypothetical protein